MEVAAASFAGVATGVYTFYPAIQEFNQRQAKLIAERDRRAVGDIAAQNAPGDTELDKERASRGG